uniref:Uncharacterized protein n=1 Tax=Fagus sylvatica TaxID=28930 RepID=A0A2N9G852_FAGSY
MEHSSSKMTSMVMILLVIASCLSISQVPRAEEANVNLMQSVKISIVNHQVFPIVLMEYANVGKP